MSQKQSPEKHSPDSGLPAETARSRSGFRKWLVRSVVALVLVLILAAVLVRPWFWTHAKTLSPTQQVQPPTPVMSMASYGEIVDQHERPYIREYSNGPNRVLLFGISHHTGDPEHQDIRLLKQYFDDFQPTTCLIESRLGIWIAGHDGLTRQFGESGSLAWHARQNGCELYTIEPRLEDEVRGVLEDHRPEHVALLYVLRPYFGARRGGPIADPAARIAEPLRKRTRIPGIDKTIKTVEDIDEIWQRDFKEFPDWRDCDDRHGWPGILNDVAAKGNQVRNRHWINVIASFMNSPDSKRVMLVVGCSHVVRLEPALDSLFTPEPPASGDDRPAP